MNKDNAKDYLPLVQALAEGLVIQLATTTGEWRDHLEPDFTLYPQEYRIKPEPREIWVNRHRNGSDGVCTYDSKEEAESGIGLEWKAIRYREVLE